eukprot:589326-Rhodomonas_salina.3
MTVRDEHEKGWGMTERRSCAAALLVTFASSSSSYARWRSSTCTHTSATRPSLPRSPKVRVCASDECNTEHEPHAVEKMHMDLRRENARAPQRNTAHDTYAAMRLTTARTRNLRAH